LRAFMTGTWVSDRLLSGSSHPIQLCPSQAAAGKIIPTYHM
jgi:hypothetical protein